MLKKLLLTSLFLLSLSFQARAVSVSSVMLCGHEKNPLIYTTLNYGLYWFADIDHLPYCTKNKDNVQFFNSNKPHTLIFVHGWLPYSVHQHKRFSFNAEDISGPKVTDLIAPWLKGDSGDKKPWNVGVFYWNQFSDESPNKTDTHSLMQAVHNAESKIWSAHDAVNMRWRNAQDQFNLFNADHNQTIPDLFYENYANSLKNYSGDVRLVGASLGTQIVIETAKRIDDAVQARVLPKNLLPRQIVLLDPVITDSHNSAHMKTLLADLMQLEKDGVVVSGYRTSILGDTLLHTDDNTDLLKYTAFSQINPCNYSIFALMSRHTAGIWWYFLSYQLTHVPIVGDPTQSAPFANLPEDQLKALMSPDAPGFKSDSHNACQSDALDREWRTWQMKRVNKKEM